MTLALVPPCMPAENPRRPAGGRAAKARVPPRVRVASTPADAVARISPAGDIVRATGSLAKMLGHADLRCLVGANIAELCAKPWDGSRLLTRLVDETSVRNYRMGLRRADGAVLAVRIDARGVRDRRGKLRSVEVELRDASRTKKGERKAPRRAAARERKAEKTIRRIVAAIPEAAVVHASDDGTIVEANQRFESLACLTRDELLERPLTSLALWADGAEIRASFDALATAETVRDRAVGLRRGDGTVGRTLVTAVRIELAGRACVLSFVRDVGRMERTTEEPPEAVPPIEAAEAAEAVAHPGAAKPFVLVVDADPETRIGMTETLQAQYEVVTAATEPEARALLAEHVGRIAIILMDAALGGIDDGLRFAKSLRDEATWRDVPIMATIPRALPEYEKTALAAGCNGYLVKLSRLEPASPDSPATDLDERPFRPRPVGWLPRTDWRGVCRRVIRQALR
jgi:PAS domain S-box-containing protein